VNVSKGDTVVIEKSVKMGPGLQIVRPGECGVIERQGVSGAFIRLDGGVLVYAFKGEYSVADFYGDDTEKNN
jgi:hypothetical protein